MADLTGHLLADFSDFTRAVDAAVVSLKSFESGAGQVDKSLSRMVDNFSGRKVIQDATLMAEAVEKIGGVSKLTQDELARVSAKAAEATEKLRLMGQEVPANLQKLAAATKDNTQSTSGWNAALSTLTGTFGALSMQRVIDEVIRFGKEVFDDADLLTRLHDRTEIGVETLQRLRIAGDDAGVGLDAMANAVNKLQRNLGEGNASTVGALQQLGLQLGDLKKLSPEQQFYAIAAALKTVQDPAEQVALAVQLFGKAGAEMLPVIKRGFDDVKDSSAVMGSETVKVLDDLADAVGRWGRAVKAEFGEETAALLTGTSVEFLRLKSAMQNLPVVAEQYETMWGQILPPSVPKELDDITAKSDAWAKESQAVAAAMVELNAVGRGWQGTLNTIDGAVVEAIKYYLAAGVAQDKLATAYGLTAAQVKAVDSALKDETESFKLEAKATEESAKLWDEYNSVRVAHGGTATDKQIADIDRWYEDLVAKLQLAGTYNDETATAAWAVWHEKLEGVNVDFASLSRHSRGSLQEIAEKAQATFEYLLANSGDYTAAFIRQKGEEAAAAQRAAEHWWQTFDDAGTKVAAKAAAVGTAVQTLIGQFVELGNGYSELKTISGGSETYDLSTASGMARFKAMNPGATITGEALDPNWFKTHTLEDAIRAGLITLPTGQTDGGMGLGGPNEQALKEAREAAQAQYLAALRAGDAAAAATAIKKIPTFAEGGSGDFGAGTLAMLHGREAIVPLTSTGAATTVVNNYISMVDTEANLARRVSEYITQSIMRNSRIS